MWACRQDYYYIFTTHHYWMFTEGHLISSHHKVSAASDICDEKKKRPALEESEVVKRFKSVELNNSREALTSAKQISKFLIEKVVVLLVMPSKDIKIKVPKRLTVEKFKARLLKKGKLKSRRCGQIIRC